MIRQVLTSLILFATIPLGELHTFWHNDRTVQNWIIDRPTPMLIQWNVKYLIGEILPVCYFFAWILYKKNPVNDAVIKSFLLLACMDLMMYLWNYKTGAGFGSIYFWFIVFFMFTLKRKELANWLDKSP